VAAAAPHPPRAAAPPVTGATPAHGATTSRSTQGVASWLDIAAGTCANNDAPMGTILTVTNAAGISVTCKVVSRGPFGLGRVVDLARTTFARLGPVSQGLVGVSVTW
jgi:rare lipoprotein A (peptidoglycan hydrolase)